ncbi:peroxisome proliferator-activated receptor gamma coactivator-related protein 1-like [Mixophyes fleayi]|uniref:peroxisome proliferator-activated receptor gamma coactivator-related protein 1-like n=1 Tax=Mixophyes fleayi TaxID=3061075 RepID=UPI003F4E04BB
MAARWGTGEEILTIGGMEFFTAGGRHQCHDLDEEDTYEGLSDLALSTLDAGGILGTVQGYIDNSIISIIGDTGAQAENKGHLDEANELSLLTALTEILDNADDENMSPFDTIPDTELLVSSKGRDTSSTDGRYSGPNWDLFPDCMSSITKRHSRRKSIRGCLPRRERPTEPTRQRSDGEDDEVQSPEKKETNPGLLAFDKGCSIETGAEIDELDHERFSKQRTPCIINTENVTLHDLVKYMHPYCLPSITVCLEPEDSESLLNEAVFLEIVSDQGECIKVPVVVEHPGDVPSAVSSEDNPPTLDSSEELDVETQSLPAIKSSPEQCVPKCDINNENHVSSKEDSIDEDLDPMKENECLNKAFTHVPGLEEISTKPLISDKTVDTILDDKSITDDSDPNLEGMVPDCQKNNQPGISVPVTIKETVQLKGKKSRKDKQAIASKSKVKSKNKGASEDKLQDVADTVTQQSVIQPATSRVSNPSLQESDFLVKTLDQVKKDSQMELRSLKLSRTKGRTRASLDRSNLERKMTTDTCKKGKFTSMEKEQSKCIADVAEMDCGLGQINPKLDGDQSTKSDATPGSVVDDDMQSDRASGQDLMVSAASDTHEKETSNMEEMSPSKSEDVTDCDSTQCTKETKSKSLSLSEYRKRLQHRKPNPEQEHENVSCSKWPSLLEPPTELAELPCLIVPTKSNKTSVEEKTCIPNKAENSSSGLDVPVRLGSVPSKVALPPLSGHEAPQLKPVERPCTTIADIPPPPMMASQINAPPPFYPPTWPTVSSYPAYYPGMPPLPVVPHFPNCMPPIIPMQPPPPVPRWPSFPPPPIAVGPVHPSVWVPGPLPPYWPNPQVSQRIPDNRCMQSSVENSVPFCPASLNTLPEEQMPKYNPLPPIEYNIQNAVLAKIQTNQKQVQKPEHSGIGTKESKIAETIESVGHDKSAIQCLNNASSKVGPQVCPNLEKSNLQSSPSRTVEKAQSKPLADSMKANVTAPDQKSANQVVFKIMDILKRAQKLGFQIKPPLVSSVSVPSTPPGEKSPLPATLKSAEAKQTILASVNTEDVQTPVAVIPSIVPAVKPKLDDKLPATECVTSKEAVEDGPLTACIVANQKAEESVLPSPGEDLRTSGESIQPVLPPVSDRKEPEERFTGESGIEASDLTSLLEQFEKYEAKDEECLPHGPDKLAEGASGSVKHVEKKIHDKLTPEMVTTSGVSHSAAPPHQLCKTIISGPWMGKSKSLLGQDRTCSSPLKTAKLIEAKPLPQSRLRNRNHGSVPPVALPPVHVAFGEHDYCILSSSRPAQDPATAGNRAATVTLSAPSQCEEGSRWNVKHHQNITIKPIVQFNTPQNIVSPKLPLANAPSVVAPSTDCGLVKPVAPCNSIQKDSNDPLDHRTPVVAESAVTSPTGSVLRSSDSLPDHNERGESRTDVKRENASVSRRSLRCYRKHSSSPSPQKATCSERSSGSRSDSASSSRSRSRSPPSKRRRRTYRSRSRHRSRSSSRSSCDTSCSSRSSSCSSRSCSPSSSRSRSRSRSPYRQGYRSRRRKSRDSYHRQKNYRKEQAIEERRVVYIGKINGRMTRSELSRRFSVFGEVEECTLHFREKGDNYGFVTYRCTGEAYAAIENGHKLRLPDELPFDLCFGGRRQFCKRNYADLDPNREDFDPVPVRSKLETLDFETLLREAQKSLRR